MRCLRPLMLASFAALALASCSPSTTMLNSWSAPDYRAGSIKKIVIIGVAKNPGIRRSYEDKFVKALHKMHYVAEASYTYVPELANADTATVKAALEEKGFTHVLTTRLIDKRTVETYVPPTVNSVGYSPYYPSYYGSWGSYSSMGYAYSVDPGYTTQDVVVSLETNLYDVELPGLIWSGVTQTWLDSSPSTNIDSVIQTTVQELKKKKIL